MNEMVEIEYPDWYCDGNMAVQPCGVRGSLWKVNKHIEEVNYVTDINGKKQLRDAREIKCWGAVGELSPADLIFNT